MNSEQQVFSKTKGNTFRSYATDADNISFEEPVRKAPKRVPTLVNYVGDRQEKVVTKKSTSRVSVRQWLVRGVWMVFALLALRLVFMERGVLDYYAKERLLGERQDKLEMIRKENRHLTQEIVRIRTNGAYQKKIVRDNLGVIDSDEYLVLFARETASSPI